MQLATRLCLLTTLGIGSGCHLYLTDKEPLDEDSESEQRKRVVADVLLSPIRDVDLLFVIDNSGSMLDEQQSLAAWAEDSLFGVLKTQALEDFNLHVAVISTDVGAGPSGIQGCSSNGDNGRMQNLSRGEPCPTPSDAYISNVAGPEGTRIKNHEGSVSEAFACIAQLGTTGCGFEQTLESMKRALDGSNSNNAGFLRDDALLAVIIVSDEDDCSAQDTFVFDSSFGFDELLGPLASFRCFEHGVICDPDDPRTPGTQTACRSREHSQYMAPIAGYSDFLKGLKADPSLIVVGGITGPSASVRVTLGDDGDPGLDTVCESSITTAAPAVRLDNFFAEFPARNTVASICNESLERPLSQVAHRISETANQVPCLVGEIQDQDAEAPGLQRDCEASIVLGDVVTELGLCGSDSPEPCYLLVADPDQCSTSPSTLAVRLENAPQPQAGAHLVVRCR
jgi:hypothetical protein